METMEAVPVIRYKEHASEERGTSARGSASLQVAFPLLEPVPEQLGSARFKRDYGLRYAYLCGSMYRGIASRELVVTMGKAGLMGFLGTGGLAMERIRSDIEFIQRELSRGQAYGVNLICNVSDPAVEVRTIE